LVALPGPGAGGSFFEQMLTDLLKLMGGSQSTGARVDMARTLAHAVATGGQPESNVDPHDRMQFEELTHIAELHVAELTGLSVTGSGGHLEVVAVGPGAWAWHTVEDWRFLLDAMSASPAPGDADSAASAAPSTPNPGDLAVPPPAAPPGLGLADLEGSIEPTDPGELAARFMTTMGPMLAAMQLGSAVGHLARATLGAYELPIPRPSGRLLVVPANATTFAAEWSLVPDEVRLWISLREVTSHAVLSRPHVADRLHELLTAVVGGIAQDAAGVMERLQGVDVTEPEALQGLLGDPAALFNVEVSPARQRVAADLMAVTAAWLGYVEYVLDQAATRLLGGRGAIAEAWRRRQMDRQSAERAAESMLGLDLGPEQIDRGTDFVRGVVDRAGEEGLARLWGSARTLPTPTEVDAPGLWLERIDLGADSSDGAGKTDPPDGGGAPPG
jgi:putative hydrolase